VSSGSLIVVCLFIAMVAYRHIASSSSSVGHDCDVCDCPLEWHFHVVWALLLLLPVLIAYSLHSLRVGSFTAFAQAAASLELLVLSGSLVSC
jgi:hypothetical protein